MKIKGHGNGIAIALSALAVVLAGAGTAAAVTATVVNIADPTTPSHVAHVDSSGRLSTIGGTSTINSFRGMFVGRNVLTSPSAASLAVTRLAAQNPATNGTTNFDVALEKINVGADGQCGDGTLATVYSSDRLAVGANLQDSYVAPIVVKPTGSTKYCIATDLEGETGNPGSYFSPAVQLSAYVLHGTYTGLGTG